MNSEAIGKKRREIAEGYIPDRSHVPEPEMLSPRTLCLLNATDSEAHVHITIFFSDRDPVAGYVVRRLRLGQLINPCHGNVTVGL